MKLRKQRIRTTPDYDAYNQITKITIGGWFCGKETYLRIGDSDKNYLGALSGQKLYRLAKAIVKQFEEE